ncbi:MAG TPA: hypothetical protein PKX14_15015, partial [Thauera aminoaromatica]|nr:hypothetical protein [Thauera aminoaromatica]
LPHPHARRVLASARGRVAPAGGGNWGLSPVFPYARIRAGLERQGTPIGGNDLWIAAQALALGAVLVTDNVKEFSCVPGLAVENWLSP